MLKIVTDIKTYLAFMLAAFFGPTYPLIGSLVILAVIDIAVGYIKNKRKNGEPFKVSKLGVKLAQFAAFLVALAAACICDQFFINNGLPAFWVATKVCDAYGYYQFLKIVENLGQWLPIVNQIKELISKINKKEEVPNDKDIQE